MLHRDVKSCMWLGGFALPTAAGWRMWAMPFVGWESCHHTHRLVRVEGPRTSPARERDGESRDNKREEEDGATPVLGRSMAN